MLLLFVRRWLALGLFTLALAGIVGAAACGGSTGGGLVPITGVLVRSETLTSAHGCGTGPTNVYKYSVVVFGYSGGDANLRESYRDAITANIFDCFVDGTFVKLPPRNGSTRYRLEVYAWTQTGYFAQRDAIEKATASNNADHLVDAGDSLGPGLKQTSPTWTTVCTATQADNVETVANCDPLTPGTGAEDGATRITVDTSKVFHLPDGRTAICASLFDGGLPDSGTPDASDAGDASDASDAGDADANAAADSGDASADGGIVTFTSARIRYRIGATVGPSVDVACPATQAFEVSREPVTYTVDVGLVAAPDVGDAGDAGLPIGIVECTVTSTTGASSTAVCP